MTIPPPPATAPKAWYIRWWAIVLYLVVFACAIGVVANLAGQAPGGGDADESAAETTGAAAEEAEEAEKAAAEFAVSYETATHSGIGDATIPLPDGATEGMVTASHEGSANFVVSVLDPDNQPTFDLLVNEIGAYEGTSAFGLYRLGPEPGKLKITADGAWEIAIASFDAAPRLELPVEGRGDAVYVYDGGAADWTLSHDGGSNFVVNHFALDSVLGGGSLLVNEIGAYEGTVPVTGALAVVTITADGSWKITAP